MRFTFPDGEMQTWASLGATTDSSVRVWLRDPSFERRTATMHIEGQPVAEAQLQPAPAHDGVAWVDLALPTPAPLARFTVEVAGMTRAGILAPGTDAPEAFSFGFGSCHQPFRPGPAGRLTRNPSTGIYRHLRHALDSSSAHFMLLLGDQVYSDGIPDASVRDVLKEQGADVDDDELLEIYRHLYRGYLNERNFRGVLEAVPSYMMWDDHDILDDWGSIEIREDYDHRVFQAASTVYREYQALHDSGMTLEDVPPYDFHFWHGNVGFLILDLRSRRDITQERVLDEEQWQRIERFLAEAGERDVPTVFIGSTIPVVHFSPAAVRCLSHIPLKATGDIRDRWDAAQFVDDRNRLLDTVFAWQAGSPERQAVVLSGDVHAGAAFHLRQQGGKGEALQWTSSSMTAPVDPLQSIVNFAGTRLVNWGEHRCRVRFGGTEPRHNFGMVTVQPSASGRGHDLELRLYGYDVGRDSLRNAVHVHSSPHSR